MTYDTHSQLDAWRREVPGGGAYLLDPTTGTVLDPHKPHGVLLADDRLRSGYEFWQQSDNKLTIFYGRHVEAADLGDDGSFEEHMEWCSAYGMEGVGWRQGQLPRVMAMYADIRNSFDRRILGTAQRMGKLATYYDIENISAEPENLYFEQQNIMEGLRERYRADQVDSAPLRDLSCIMVAFREWYMVCRLGYELLSQSNGLNPAAEDMQKTFITVGAGHTDLTRKFQTAGVTEVKTLGFSMKDLLDAEQISEKAYRAYQLMVRAVASGVIAPEYRDFL